MIYKLQLICAVFKSHFHGPSSTNPVYAPGPLYSYDKES